MDIAIKHIKELLKSLKCLEFLHLKIAATLLRKYPQAW